MLNTLETQRKLVAAGLAVEKKHSTLPLSLFKYHRSVMYDYKWFDVPELMECRGHVYDTETGELVVAAPRKSFNYLENNWWKDVPLTTNVRAEVKYNGFLACVSKYRGEILVTTTGSFDSAFVEQAKLHIDAMPGTTETLHFEICDSVFDPHIVAETDGAKYLGTRSKKTGETIVIGSTMPYPFMELGEAINMAEDFNGEGFMLHNIDLPYFESFRNVCKLKSPYYVGKKMLMRKKIAFLRRSSLPLMWHKVYDLIRELYSVEEWDETDEQTRRKILEELYAAQ